MGDGCIGVVGVMGVLLPEREVRGGNRGGIERISGPGRVFLAASKSSFGGAIPE